MFIWSFRYLIIISHRSSAHLNQCPNLESNRGCPTDNQFAILFLDVRQDVGCPFKLLQSETRPYDQWREVIAVCSQIMNYKHDKITRVWSNYANKVTFGFWSLIVRRTTWSLFLVVSGKWTTAISNADLNYGISDFQINFVDKVCLYHVILTV